MKKFTLMELLACQGVAQRAKRSRMFTLIELLVVIAIIAILASMLMPSLVLARYQAKNVVCINNLKSVAAGIQMYTGDYDSFYPTDRSHITRMGVNPCGIYDGTSSAKYDMRTPLLPYFSGSLKGVWQCPLAGSAYRDGAVYGDIYGRGTATSINIDTYNGNQSILTTYANYSGREAHTGSWYSNGLFDGNYQGQVRMIQTPMMKVGDILQFYLVSSQAAFQDNEYNLLSMDSFYYMKGDIAWIHRNPWAVFYPETEKSRYYAMVYPQPMDINFALDDGAVLSTKRALPTDTNSFVQTNRQREDYGWFIPLGAKY